MKRCLKGAKITKFRLNSLQGTKKCKFPKFYHFYFSSNFNAGFCNILISMLYFYQSIKTLSFFLMEWYKKGHKFYNFTYLEGIHNFFHLILTQFSYFVTSSLCRFPPLVMVFKLSWMAVKLVQEEAFVDFLWSYHSVPTVTQGFQYFSSVPVPHYLQVVLFKKF